MRYFIVDLDDTLLKGDKTVNEYTLNGIEKLKKLGFIFVFNTARNFEMTEECIDYLKPDYAIMNAGALICDKNKNIIYTKTIKTDDVNYIIDELKNDNEIFKFSIQTPTKLISKDIDSDNLRLHFTYFDFESEFKDEAVKIMISGPNIDKWKKIAKDFGYEFERYFNGTWFRISASDKYQGNLALFKLLNDDNPEDYVFGDDHGDVDMVNNAYYGALLKNSLITDKCKNITDYDSNNDGVIRHMEKLLNL